MPEGDTIHHAARRIRAVLEGRTPDEILTPHPRHSFERWPERLAGRAVRSVDAHGKHLFIRFDGASIDLTDGYIHFSSGAQARETAKRHFAGMDDLLLIAVDAEALGEKLMKNNVLCI